MGLFLAFILVCTIVASSSGLEIENNEPLCPPREQIHPCTCSVTQIWVQTVCKDIKNQKEISDIFSKNPNWKLEIVQFEQCTFNYIPSSIMDLSNFKNLNIFNSTLVSLFDTVPGKNELFQVYMKNAKFLRGLQWQFFSNSRVFIMDIRNTEIPSIGNSFKEHMSTTLNYLKFENTKTAKIKDQAFQRMVNLGHMELSGGSLKKLSRDMFPRPWNIKILNFNRQKLPELPKDFFADLPKLESFSAKNNYFTTLSEEVFPMKFISYQLNDNPIVCDCLVKWTVTASTKWTYFQGTCAEPESFKGRELKSLKEDDFRYCQ